MKLLSCFDSDKSELSISIQGRFDIHVNEDFINSYQQLEAIPAIVTVDLNHATHIDSSALGMLLILRDHVGGDKSDVRIQNCNLAIEKILLEFKFQQLFSIKRYGRELR